MSKRICAADGCDRPHHCKGYCGMHYQRLLRHGTLEKPRRRLKGRLCSIDGCGRPHLSKGYCSMHYQRSRSALDDMRPERLMAEPGSGCISDGYRKVRADGKTWFEHRYVMEQALGRPLFPDENVHHINGDRADNRLENLELWSTSQPAGQRVEDKVEWAQMILTRYGHLESTQAT